MSVALIELSPETPVPLAAAAPPPPYRYRRLGLALAALLVLVLGGAAPASSALWWRLGEVPLPAGGDFGVTADRIYTVDLEADPRVVTAWQTDPVRRLWSIKTTGMDDRLDVGELPGGLVMVAEVDGVSVRDSRTGAVRWVSPAPVQPLDDRIGVIQQQRFRPGTEYDPESGDPGRLYGTNGGALHTEPALSTELRGVELAGGRQIWSVTVPGSVFTAWPDPPVSGLVLLSARKLTLLSPATGAVLRERAVPRVDGRDPVMGEVVEDMVLVHYGAFGEGGPVIAYELNTLDERWRQNRSDPAGNSASCPGLTCVVGHDDLTVLDPRTGTSRWRVAGADVFAFGTGSVLQAEAGSMIPLRAVSLDTGRTQVELAGWREFSEVRGGGGYLLRHPDKGRSSVFGLLRPGRAAVQPLGRIPGPVLNCTSVPGVVACPTLDHVEVWAYRG
ncbi:PQQ-binding-like beta-propeller repeat protein [Actinoplanes sp. NPDC049668]|uniref:outer membrane protein assembly factor BamB family protein n=1 Tax=unclassified Actinoplanes TaxID=2626549 RepID=UPI0033AC49C9